MVTMACGLKLMVEQTIIVELNRLMDEQMKVLESRFDREEAIEYAIRAARIRELLATLRANGNDNKDCFSSSNEGARRAGAKKWKQPPAIFSGARAMY